MRRIQSSICCPCGRESQTAGLCATCYTLHRHDQAYFGGLREAVLRRDGYRCQCCGASGRGKRKISVHHRLKGVSTLKGMITVCMGCHAKIHRTRVSRYLTGLLLVLWREQHPGGHEQTCLELRGAA